MKLCKTLTALALCSSFSAVAQANNTALDVEVTADINYWHTNLTMSNIVRSYDVNTEGQVMAGLSIEHNEPRYPNLRVRFATLNEQKDKYRVGTPTDNVIINDADYKYNADLIGYYEMLNRPSAQINMGLGAKVIDDDVLAQAYASVDWGLMIDKMSASTEIAYAINKDVYTMDVVGKVKYALDENVDAQLGYKKLSMMPRGTNNISVNHSGFFVGAQAKF